MRLLKDNQGLVRLKAQHTVELPMLYGNNNVRINVIKGKIQLNHGSYTPDGGTWLMNPNGGRTAHYPMIEGQTYDLVLDIRKSFGKQDRITIVNTSLFRQAEFTFIVRNDLN